MAGIKLTPEKLAEHYTCLKATMPFKWLNLPDASKLAFKITRDKRFNGYFHPLKSGWVIAISENYHIDQLAVQKTMSHEMIHVAQEVRRKGSTSHGVSFQTLADDICKYFGYDREGF